MTVTQPVVITPGSDPAAAQRKLDRARLLLDQERFQEAAALFDEVVVTDPMGPLVASARFHAGLAWQASGSPETALARLIDVVRRFPESEVAKPAALRAAHLLAYRERFGELSELADQILRAPNLAEIERIEALGMKALALVEVGDPDAAQVQVSRARDIIEMRRLGESGPLPLELAPVYFALGEIRKHKSERVVFVPMPSDFAATLEERCQGLLDAQSAYTETMRTYDAHWASMSGYRVGQLYQALHRDVSAIPVPKSADTEEKKQLFLGAMRLRYRILLEKGKAMMEHTVLIEERTGQSGAWIDRAREALAELERALASEKAALACLPYTEAELRRALDELAAKPRARATAPARKH